MADINGTPDSDTINGTEDADRIFAGGGDDTVTANGGDDEVHGEDGNDTLNGGADNDQIDGGIDNDILDGSGGNDSLTGGLGDDTVRGGEGDDHIYADTVSAGDIVDGENGVDTYELDGDFSAGLIFGANSMFRIENLVLAAGHDYSLQTNDRNVAAGAQLLVDASLLGAGDDFTFVGTGENDGSFRFDLGQGVDDIAGSDRNDTFLLDPLNFAASDRLNGHTGSDRAEFQGNFGAMVLDSATFLRIETLAFKAGTVIDLQMQDSAVGAGQEMVVDASAMVAGDSLTFLGTGENDGHFRFIPGAGTDNIRGSDRDDVFQLTPGGFAVTDSLNGHTGSDRAEFQGAFGTVTLGASTLLNIETLKFLSGTSIDLRMNESAVAPGQEMLVDASAMGSSDSFAFLGSGENDGHFRILGHVGFDNIFGSDNNDYISFATPSQNAWSQTDIVNGHTGFDTLEIGDPFGNTANIANIEKFAFVAGSQGTLTFVDSTVRAGAELLIDASATLFGNSLNLLGGAETDGHFYVVAGHGDEIFTGGAGDDYIRFDSVIVGQRGTFKNDRDRVDGGAGNDTLEFNGANPGDFQNLLTIFGGSSQKSFETVKFTGSGDMTVTMSSTLAAGDEQLVDASGKGLSNFNFTATGGGTFRIIGASGADTINGGAGHETIVGGLGGDTLNGGAGADTFEYASASEATSTSFDTLQSVDPTADRIDLPGAVSAVRYLDFGALSTTSLDADLDAALDSLMGPNEAVLFTPDSGNQAGVHWLIVDGNGVAGYQAGADFVFRMAGLTNLTIDVAFFQ